MTVPVLLAHDARTAAILEGMNERVPGMPRDLPDMMRDLAFRRTLVHSETALALISTHPDEPAPDMAFLAGHAITRCRGGAKDPEGGAFVATGRHHRGGAARDLPSELGRIA